MNMKMFSTYYKAFPCIDFEYLNPIQGGGGVGSDFPILSDATGDNISDKNPYYGELTVWYWVWRNYLPIHKEIDYIGFCHYRRYLDFRKKPSSSPVKRISCSQFIRHKEYYLTLPSPDDPAYFTNYDIILPKPLVSQYTLERKYGIRHRMEDFYICKEVIKELYPEYIPAMESVCASHSAYHYLTFVMRRELFESLATWAFNILFEVERRCQWEQYTSYDDIRTPAYLLERFFNVWLAYHLQEHKYTILHRRLWLLIQGNPWKRRLGTMLSSCIPIRSLRQRIRKRWCVE